MKIGLDFHGVIDTHTERYVALSKAMIAAGHEVHIVTGQVLDDEMEQRLKDMGIAYTHYFSIVEYHEGLGHKIEWVDGLPYMNETLWNKTKAEYAEKVGLDWMIDDSPRYGRYFTGSCLYLQQLR